MSKADVRGQQTTSFWLQTKTFSSPKFPSKERACREQPCRVCNPFHLFVREGDGEWVCPHGASSSRTNSFSPSSYFYYFFFFEPTPSSHLHSPSTSSCEFRQRTATTATKHYTFYCTKQSHAPPRAEGKERGAVPRHLLVFLSSKSEVPVIFYNKLSHYRP